MIDHNQSKEIAFYNFARFAMAQPRIISQFKDATGNDLRSLVSGNLIERMINKATGYEDAIFSEFLEWLRLTYWE